MGLQSSGKQILENTKNLKFKINVKTNLLRIAETCRNVKPQKMSMALEM